ncbi:hypothetical protein W02_34840 [Nitrospira sp. KM1]|uniref:PepSY domain-containing protein n=1 Tax=Nitrospira sp. KM1 TaxID=1936990 RepID=UPI0013A79E2C|nr:PepSY domain-containing protein [Nitrospira sp. KM1]BCA56344.1 hypothetical protein W02_34840 [Nitrospira sp. KM1]
MNYDYERLMRAKRDVKLISACSLTIDQAIQVAVSRIGGSVYDVKLKEVDHRVVWRIKLFAAGRRVKVYVDGVSGNVLGAKAEIFTIEPSKEAVLDAGFSRTSEDFVFDPLQSPL